MTETPNPAFADAPQAPDFSRARDPFALFASWFEDAKAREPNDPNAMALATVDETGLPNVRMVLLKDFSPAGFVFYTNFESAKGRELLSAGKAAICFHWKSLRRQVRARGAIATVPGEEADAYFASRPLGSRIGAWASQQSRPLESRFALEKAVARYTAQYALTGVPRPAHWSGFRLTPLEIEFWHDRPFRLHDRTQFRRETETGEWRTSQLYP